MGRFIFLTLSLLVMAFSLNGAKGCCPQYWLPKNEFCYKVFNELNNWNNAKALCRKQGSGCHLASIHSYEESTDLAKYISGYPIIGEGVWIGLNDPQKNRTWQWIDRSNYSNQMWEDNEPNNKGNNEYCVELRKKSRYKQWNDENCASRRVYLCKCRFYCKFSSSCCVRRKVLGET